MEVRNLANDYICLACGSHFLATSQAERECVKCGSTNVMKLSPSNLFGFFGGG